MYIILGPPLTNRIFDGTDAYDPCESWSYQGVEEYGLPHAFTLLFYQKGRIGDYILYQPGMEGPWSLLSNYHGDMTNYLEGNGTIVYNGLDGMKHKIGTSLVYPVTEKGSKLYLGARWIQYQSNFVQLDPGITQVINPLTYDGFSVFGGISWIF